MFFCKPDQYLYDAYDNEPYGQDERVCQVLRPRFFHRK